ncbi:MAG: nucleotidyltransferase family protein [Thalassotalea sp.]
MAINKLKNKQQVAMPKLVFLLMAAGQSKRLGQPKQLVAFNQQPLINKQIELLLPFQLPVYCVLGSGFEKIAPVIAQLPVEIIQNKNWLDGLGASIAYGVSQLPKQIDAVMVLLTDQWCLTANDIQSLLDAWHHQLPSQKQLQTMQSEPLTSSVPIPASIIVSSNAHGDKSPPIIFPKDYFSELKRLSGDDGAKQVLKAHQDQVQTVAVENAFFDLDTPEQLSEFIKKTAQLST